MTPRNRYTLLLYILVKVNLWYSSEAFVHASSTGSSKESSDMTRFYKDDKNVKVEPNTLPRRTVTRRKKAVIESLESLDEIKYFLEDDERFSAIKFYAPWCKTCQRIGKQFDRLAMEMGDRIVDRKQVQGQIRCAQVQCASPNSFITEQLYVMALPTVHLYYGSQKVWEGTGKTSIKELKTICSELQCLSRNELRSHAESVDDGVLLKALEGTMYISPSFLDEEW